MNNNAITLAYLETKALMERAKTVANIWSVEWKIKDFIKDCIKDGFSKEDIQLLLTIVMNEQFTIATDELNDENLIKNN
jgi:hypothetical protein